MTIKKIALFTALAFFGGTSFSHAAAEDKAYILSIQKDADAEYQYQIFVYSTFLKFFTQMENLGFLASKYDYFLNQYNDLNAHGGSQSDIADKDLVMWQTYCQSKSENKAILETLNSLDQSKAFQADAFYTGYREGFKEMKRGLVSSLNGFNNIKIDGVKVNDAMCQSYQSKKPRSAKASYFPLNRQHLEADSHNKRYYKAQLDYANLTYAIVKLSEEFHQIIAQPRTQENWVKAKKTMCSLKTVGTQALDNIKELKDLKSYQFYESSSDPKVKYDHLFGDNAYYGPIIKDYENLLIQYDESLSFINEKLGYKDLGNSCN